MDTLFLKHWGFDLAIGKIAGTIIGVIVIQVILSFLKRGGISVALGLFLPYVPQRGVVLAITYTGVVFSIIVQGLTVGRLIRREQGFASG